MAPETIFSNPSAHKASSTIAGCFRKVLPRLLQKDRKRGKTLEDRSRVIPPARIVGGLVKIPSRTVSPAE
jgi:hypothetical protein